MTVRDLRQTDCGPYSWLIPSPAVRGNFPSVPSFIATPFQMHYHLTLIVRILQHFKIKNHVIPQFLSFVSKSQSRILSLGFSCRCTPHNGAFATILILQQLWLKNPASFLNWKQELRLYLFFFLETRSQLRIQVCILIPLKMKPIIWTGGILYNHILHSWLVWNIDKN